MLSSEPDLNPHLPRRLSPEFMQCLQTGFLSGLRQSIASDIDLNLELRAGYLNVYYKGNSLLKLTERSAARYQVEVHPQFSAGLPLPTQLDGADTAQAFLDIMPRLKQAIGQYGQRSLELEYEQLIIRANNAEARNNSEYFIIDRQYVRPTGRFDLLGFFWDRNGRRRGQTVPLCLFEIKFALNPEIAQLHLQLQTYYTALQEQAADLAGEMQTLLRQKLDLGAFHLPQDRVDAMKTLTISADPKQIQLVILLVDYNPNSRLLNLDALSALPFADQVRLLRTGFAMWQQTVLPVKS